MTNGMANKKSAMRRYLPLALALLLGCLTPMSAREPVDVFRLFHKFSIESPWNLTGDPQLVVGRELLETGKEIGEYALEYQIEKAFRGNFIHQTDSLSVTLTVFRAPSQMMAFGFYSAPKSPSLPFFDVGFESYFTRGKLFCWYGRFVLVSETADTLKNSEKYLKDCVENIVKLLPAQKRKTPILDALPEKNRVAHSEKFYVHHWLDQNYFENIYYADYYTKEGYSRIFIIDNKTTAAADSNFWKYYSFIKKNARILDEQLNIATDYFVVEEPLWGKTLLAKKNQIIYGILDFRNKKWTEDRLDDLLSHLKKRKVVKSG